MQASIQSTSTLYSTRDTTTQTNNLQFSETYCCWLTQPQCKSAGACATLTVPICSSRPAATVQLHFLALLAMRSWRCFSSNKGLTSSGALIALQSSRMSSSDRAPSGRCSTLLTKSSNMGSGMKSMPTVGAGAVAWPELLCAPPASAYGVCYCSAALNCFQTRHAVVTLSSVHLHASQQNESRGQVCDGIEAREKKNLCLAVRPLM